MDRHELRPATQDDVEAIKELAVAAQMFAVDEVGAFDEMLAAFFDGSAEGARWVVAGADREVSGAAYFAPEPFADRVWNLYFLAVHPTHQGSGVGSQLIRHVEETVRALGPELARILIVETSATDQYAGSRDFYERHGFVEESRIREFYGPGDDKVTFWKSLVS